MKKKIIMILSASVVTAAVAVGVSFAWFTDLDQTDSENIEAGYLAIELTGEIDDDEMIYPEEGTKIIDYEIKNNSDRDIIVEFSPGDLKMYMMPSSCLYTHDGVKYVKKDKIPDLKRMNDRHKMGIGGPSPGGIHFNMSTWDSSITDVLFGVEDDDWTVTNGRLLNSVNEKLYFYLEKDGIASCKFDIGLAASAGNEYQYSVFKFSGASALATQDLETAVVGTFGVTFAQLGIVETTEE